MLSIILSVIPAFAFALSAMSLALSLKTHYFLKRQDLTVDIWKAWISADYRKFRVISMRRLTGGMEHSPSPSWKIKYSVAAACQEHEVAIGSIEHFIVEVAAIYNKRLVNTELFDRLFEQTFTEWRKVFSNVQRDTISSRDIGKDLNDAFSILLDSRYAHVI